MSAANWVNKLMAVAVIALVAASATAQFDNPREMCRHEMRETQLDECKRYIMQMGRRSILMSLANQQGVRERCCMELRDFSPQCRCDAIEEMMGDIREEMEERYRQRRDCHMSRRMVEAAERLPSMCRIRPGYCHMRERGVITY